MLTGTVDIKISNALNESFCQFVTRAPRTHTDAVECTAGDEFYHLIEHPEEFRDESLRD